MHGPPQPELRHGIAVIGKRELGRELGRLEPLHVGVGDAIGPGGRLAPGLVILHLPECVGPQEMRVPVFRVGRNQPFGQFVGGSGLPRAKRLLRQRLGLGQGEPDHVGRGVAFGRGLVGTGPAGRARKDEAGETGRQYGGSLTAFRHWG